MEAYKKNRSEKSSDYVKDALSIIEQEYSNDSLSIEHIADRLGISSAYFGKLFTRRMNVSCTAYIQNYRIERASELLLNTSDTVQAISEKVGIVNTNYFYSLFKKKYGMTPVEYRKKH